MKYSEKLKTLNDSFKEAKDSKGKPILGGARVKTSDGKRGYVYQIADDDSIRVTSQKNTGLIGWYKGKDLTVIGKESLESKEITHKEKLSKLKEGLDEEKRSKLAKSMYKKSWDELDDRQRQTIMKLIRNVPAGNKEAISRSYMQDRNEVDQFNNKRLKVSLYDMSDDIKNTPAIWGINISASGTQSVNDTEKIVSNIKQAIDLANKLNRKKTIKFDS